MNIFSESDSFSTSKPFDIVKSRCITRQECHKQKTANETTLAVVAKFYALQLCKSAVVACLSRIVVPVYRAVLNIDV